MLWLHTQSHSTVPSNLSGGISTRGAQSAYRASNLYFPICLMPTSLMPGPSSLTTLSLFIFVLFFVVGFVFLLFFVFLFFDFLLFFFFFVFRVCFYLFCFFFSFSFFVFLSFLCSSVYVILSRFIVMRNVQM